MVRSTAGAESELPGDLGNQRCGSSLKPPVSRCDRAMSFVRFRNPRAEPRRRSRRPLMASVGPLLVPG